MFFSFKVKSQVLVVIVKVFVWDTPARFHSLFILKLLSSVPAAFAAVADPLNQHWSCG